MAGLLIGDVAERTGLTPPTIRYYESIGLLAAAPRSSTGYRRYNEAAIVELRFIRKAQTLGFSLEEIREILELSRAGTTPCARVLALARRHVETVEERIGQLSRFRDVLSAEIGKWDGTREPTCKGLCAIIAGADPSFEAGGAPNFAAVKPRRQPKKPKTHRLS